MQPTITAELAATRRADLLHAAERYRATHPARRTVRTAHLTTASEHLGGAAQRLRGWAARLVGSTSAQEPCCA